MVDIVTRLGKGSRLTHAEADANFTNLKAAVEANEAAIAAVDLSGLQPLDSDLTAIAALTTTSYGRALLTAASAAALSAALPRTSRVANPAYSGTMTVSITDVSLINITLTGDLTLNLSGGFDGQDVKIRLEQGAGGNHALTLGAKLRLNDSITDVTLSTAFGAKDLVGLVYDAGDDMYDVVAFVKGVS